MSKNKTRIERLEAITAHPETRSTYAVVSSLSEITPEMRAQRLKFYVGFDGPDAWEDASHENTNTN